MASALRLYPQTSAALVFGGMLLAGCDRGGGTNCTFGSDPLDLPDDPPAMPHPGPGFDPLGPLPGCNAALSVSSDGPALIVLDPAALEPFQLERVLATLLDSVGQNRAPEEMLQRLFDTQNSAEIGIFADNPHCNSGDNPAFKNGAAVDCPRAEGALATSTGLFTPGHPDYFAPVALVNRFDLTTKSSITCGEYRMVFAKWSGRSDANNRLFLILEGILPNPTPGKAMGCWPVVKHWASLEQAQDPATIAALLEQFYFEGLPGFQPLVAPSHFGLDATDDDDGYGNAHGQIRLSQHMQDPWELRELRIAAGPAGSDGQPTLFFLPTPVKNNPLPGLFDPASATEETAQSFTQSFVDNLVADRLAADALLDLRMHMLNKFNAGESAVDGAAGVAYASLALGGASAPLVDAIQEKVAGLQASTPCPQNDPLTAESILGRATMLTCAGCHAPERFLGPNRSIGCGLTWPNTLGEVHIDENGSLSPALTDVFLPRRASIMTTFLQACDTDTILENLAPNPPASTILK